MNFRWIFLLLLGLTPLCTYAQSVVDTPSQYEIGEVTVRTKYHQFQVDSADRMIIYHKVLKDVADQSRMDMSVSSNGVGMGGLVTKLARIISGQQKREKAFVKDLVEDQQYRFISLRYTPQLVETLTGLSGDTASLFMVQNPMPYDYARAASDLEVKMWIRTQYRAWDARQTAKAETSSTPAQPASAADPVAARP